MKSIKVLMFFAFMTSLLSCSATNNTPSSCPAPVTGSTTANLAITTPYVAALTGCTLIDYSVPVSLGSSSGPMSLLIDSGSTTLGAASQGCTNCTSLSPEYTPSSSVQRTCATGDSEYADGTGWQGPIVNDTVSVAGIPVSTDSYVEITSQSDGFFNDSDCEFGTSGTNSNQGILGLAGKNIALTGTVGYLDALDASQGLPEIFAVQLCGSGGHIWFGNYDSNYTPSTPVYTPITIADSYFYINVKDLLVGGSSIGGTTFSGGIVVDTGTSITFLPQTYFDDIVTQITANSTFNSVFGSDFFDNGNCASTSMTEAQLDSALPTLTLSLMSTSSGTVSVTLPATRSYLDAHKIGNVINYCPGIAPDGGGSPDIIGGSFMRSQITIFDRTNARLGFAPQQPLGASDGCTY
jgi:Eukaryotic aspartyl protease